MILKATPPYLQMTHSDIIVIKLRLNSLQNVYFRFFFIFEKLAECRCFVTYLSNDPRILSTSTEATNPVTIQRVAVWCSGYWLIDQ